VELRIRQPFRPQTPITMHSCGGAPTDEALATATAIIQEDEDSLRSSVSSARHSSFSQDFCHSKLIAAIRRKQVGATLEGLARIIRF